MQSGSLFSPMSVSAAGTYGTVGAAGGFIRVNGNPMEQPGDKVIPPGSPYPPPGPTGNLHNHVGACSGATANRELQVFQVYSNPKVSLLITLCLTFPVHLERAQVYNQSNENPWWRIGHNQWLEIRSNGDWSLLSHHFHCIYRDHYHRRPTFGASYHHWIATISWMRQLGICQRLASISSHLIQWH